MRLKEPFWDTVPMVAWLATLAVTLFLYPRLPAEMPFHWGSPGEVDFWVSRATGASIGLLVSAVAYVATWLYPALVGGYGDHRGAASPHRLVRRGLVFMFLVLQMVELAAGLGMTGRRLLPLGFGLAFMAVGNVLGLVPPNRYLGTRTGATLACAEVWRRTHRFTARLLVGLGLMMIAGAAFGEWGFLTLPVAFIAAPVGSIAYAVAVNRQVLTRLCEEERPNR